MSILDELKNEDTWMRYLDQKKEKDNLSADDIESWTEYIRKKRYLNVMETLFPLPYKKHINKIGIQKKRVVYIFPNDANRVLKVIAWLLYRYDRHFSPCCYSFRQHSGPKKGIWDLISKLKGRQMYSCKIDIKDYFNSINVQMLLPMLKRIMSDDIDTYGFIQQILLQDMSISGNETIYEKRGAMAGNPISSFLANIYLQEIDDFFYSNDIPYARYSDDIIFFADTMDILHEYYQALLDKLKKLDLHINDEKVSVTGKNDKWEFLGIGYDNGIVDISDIALKKLKDKIRRKARALYRWREKKGLSPQKAIKAMIKRYNIKFFDGIGNDGYTWARWYFPVLNTDESLKVIDKYMQEQLRYIYSGRHTKINYRISYDMLKDMGYTTLVNRYYNYHKTRK